MMLVIKFKEHSGRKGIEQPTLQIRFSNRSRPLKMHTKLPLKHQTPILLIPNDRQKQSVSEMPTR